VTSTGLWPTLGTPYAHPAVAAAWPLAGVLAPRPHWSPADLRRLTRVFATRAAAELHGAARFDPTARWRLRLAHSGQVEVWLVTWTPGQSSSWHEHGTAAAYTVLDGELTETRPHGRTGTRATRRRPGRGAAAGPGHLHTLQNLGVLPAISVHAMLTGPGPR
jgi:predicted metal-dependent enzyme (double-stranded beta helix superfamily)